MRQVLEHSEIRVTGIAFANHKRLTIWHKNNHWTRWEVSVRAGLGRIPSPVNLFLNFVVDIRFRWNGRWSPTSGSRIVWMHMARSDLIGWLIGVEFLRILIGPLGNKGCVWLQPTQPQEAAIIWSKSQKGEIIWHGSCTIEQFKPNHKVQPLSHNHDCDTVVLNKGAWLHGILNDLKQDPKKIYSPPYIQKCFFFFFLFV